MRLKRNRIRKENEGKKIGIVFSLGLLIFLSIGFGFLLTQHIIIPSFFNHHVQEKRIVKQAKPEKIQGKKEEEQASTNQINTMSLKGLDIFSVQIGSFSTKENAQNMLDQLYERKMPGFILEEKGYKVIAGVMTDRNSADVFMKNIKVDYEETFVWSRSIPDKIIQYHKDDEKYIQILKEENEKFVEILKSIGNKIQEQKNTGKIQSFQVDIDSLNEIEKKANQEKISKDLKKMHDEWMNRIKDFSKELTEALKNQDNPLFEVENVFIKNLYKYLKFMTAHES
ncbi:SPOR domain-containing protein [Inediibacterium massiliense]|uniref:SPOR domain-containing protein n=1 Tax=Inediibacterium massiliense TaxID=1658111 RepID=UPI0006B61D67|nr:SPOR domain-containing protein [Inediibacterium massiliense]